MSEYDFDKYIKHELSKKSFLDHGMWKQGKKKSDYEKLFSNASARD
jgi:hypothetical protein